MMIMYKEQSVYLVRPLFLTCKSFYNQTLFAYSYLIQMKTLMAHMVRGILFLYIEVISVKNRTPCPGITASFSEQALGIGLGWCFMVTFVFSH